MNKICPIMSHVSLVSPGKSDALQGREYNNCIEDRCCFWVDGRYDSDKTCLFLSIESFVRSMATK